MGHLCFTAILLNFNIKLTMTVKKVSLEKIIANGLDFLAEFIPEKTYLYFPLLSASLIWAVKRSRQWKENILSWQVWLDPDIISSKPDEFILDFFKSSQSLNRTFKKEIEQGDIKTLRKAFVSLYPLVGLEDPFLCGLFVSELERGNYRKIVNEFEPRVSRAKKDIEKIKKSQQLLERLQSMANEALSLNLELLSQTKIRKITTEIIKAKMNK